MKKKEIIKRDCKTISNYYGRKNQEHQTVQELTELILLLTRRAEQRDGEYHANLIDEIADSCVMIEQIKLLHGISNKEVKKRMLFKLDRQLNRIEAEKASGEKS